MGPGGILFMLSLLVLGGIGLVFDDDWKDGNDDDSVDDETETVTGKDKDVTIETGDGNDTITSAKDAASIKSATIDTGAGDDTIKLDNRIETVDIDTGEGNDLVSLKYATGGTIVTRSGDDTVNGYIGDSLDIKLGDGNDQSTIDSSGYGSVNIYGEAGNDTITVTSNARVFGGEGNDTLKTSTFKVPGSTFGGWLDGGAGDDTIEIEATPLLFRDTVTGERDYILGSVGGEGEDTFSISTENFSAKVISDFIENPNYPYLEEDQINLYLLDYDNETGTIGATGPSIGDFEPDTDKISLNVSEKDGYTFSAVEITKNSDETYRPDYAADDSLSTHLNLIFKSTDETITQEILVRVYHAANTKVTADDIVFSGAKPTDGFITATA